MIQVEEVSWEEGEEEEGCRVPRSYPRPRARYTPVDYNNFTEEGKFLYREEESRRCRGGRVEILELETEFLGWSRSFQRLSRSLKIESLVLDDRLHYLQWFSPPARLRFIQLIGTTLERHESIRCLSAEFASLLQEDGIKFLLAVAVPGGSSLRGLHLWRLFRQGGLPLEVEQRGMSDVFVEPSLSQSSPQTLGQAFYRRHVQRASLSMSRGEMLLAFRTCLGCLVSLRELSVEYSMLSGGQGRDLLLLGSLGRLRRLNLLYTQSDLLTSTSRYISDEAWRSVGLINPELRVSLVAIRTLDFDLISPILCQNLPLEKVYGSSSLRAAAADEGPRLDLTTRVLVERCHVHLKSVKFSLHESEPVVDLSIKKFLTGFPALEEFEYKGPIDRIDALPQLLEETLKEDKSLKKVRLFLLEAEKSESEITDINLQFKEMFLSRGIEFEIKICCL